MTTHQALYEWFNSFGIPFYVNTSVPDDVKFPYGTYQDIKGSWNEDSVSITVNLHYYTTGEKAINAMADKIGKALSSGGIQILCDDGAMWLTKGNPFCQSIVNDEDITYKRRYINMNIEYFTN